MRACVKFSLPVECCCSQAFMQKPPRKRSVPFTCHSVESWTNGIALNVRDRHSLAGTTTRGHVKNSCLCGCYGKRPTLMVFGAFVLCTHLRVDSKCVPSSGSIHVAARDSGREAALSGIKRSFFQASQIRVVTRFSISWSWPRS